MIYPVTLFNSLHWPSCQISKRTSCEEKVHHIQPEVLQLNRKKVRFSSQEQKELLRQLSGHSADKGCDQFSAVLLAQSHSSTSALSFLLLWLPSEFYAEAQRAWVKITQPGSGECMNQRGQVTNQEEWKSVYCEMGENMHKGAQSCFTYHITARSKTINTDLETHVQLSSIKWSSTHRLKVILTPSALH